jgi:hypothetical protein
MLTKRVLQVVLTALMIFCFNVVAGAQDPDDSKAIKAEVFLNARPAKKSRSTARYRPVAKSSTEPDVAAPASGTTFAKIGITRWRFRRSKATDKTKELVEEDDGAQNEWTGERIEEATLLSPGQRVRLSIESMSREGYLYVIDREQYADGTLGDPKLIYPTQKTAGANRVQPGRLIYIPSATGRFRIEPSGSAKVQIAEVLTIIVSPKPLVSEDLLGPRSIRLERAQVDSWQKQWQSPATGFEMDGGVGQAMTLTEQSSATPGSPLLTQEDPEPQTVYQLAVRPENPVLITVALRFVKAN